MRGARRTLRDRIIRGGPGADLYTPAEVIDNLHLSYPDVRITTLHHYVKDAGDGSLGGLGDLRLILEGDGHLRVRQIAGAGVGVGTTTPTPDPALQGLVEGLQAQLSTLSQEVSQLRTAGLAVRKVVVRVEADDKPTETLTVKGPLPACFERLVALASIRQNTLMVGPSGAGKTFLSGKVAEALGLRHAFVSCSAGMSEGQVAGRLLPVEEGGRFSYVPSPFVECYEGGGLFLFDELDSADANTMTFVNAALSNGHLSLPQRPKQSVVKRHKDFVCFAAANTFGHGANRVYAGRNQLDGATLDRFRAGVVEVGYDAGVEEALCDPEVLAWGRAIRGVIDSAPLRRVMSTRVLRDFSRQKRLLGWGRAEWEQAYFADWSADDRALVPQDKGTGT